MTAAEVSQRMLTSPDGSMEPAWVVTAIEDDGVSTVIFSGIEASERATAYARSRYKPVHFRIFAETGHIGMRPGTMGTN